MITLLRLFKKNTSPKVNAHGDQYYNLSEKKSLSKRKKSKIYWNLNYVLNIKNGVQNIGTDISFY